MMQKSTVMGAPGEPNYAHSGSSEFGYPCFQPAPTYGVMSLTIAISILSRFEAAAFLQGCSIRAPFIPFPPALSFAYQTVAGI